jgi:HSP20 family molecular chaperone IbpA
MRTALAEMMSTQEVLLANPTYREPQPLSVVQPRQGKAEAIPPLFDVVEGEDFYLVSVDLPGLPEVQSEIEMRSGEIQIRAQGRRSPLTSDILFRCRSQENHVRAIYYQGALWLLLPKNGRAVEMASLEHAQVQA